MSACTKRSPACFPAACAHAASLGTPPESRIRRSFITNPLRCLEPHGKSFFGTRKGFFHGVPTTRSCYTQPKKRFQRMSLRQFPGINGLFSHQCLTDDVRYSPNSLSNPFC